MHDRWDRANHLSGCVGPKVLQLKRGAQVMLLKNLDVAKGLSNGTRGVVVGFRPPAAAELREASGSGGGGESKLAQGSAREFPVVRFMLTGSTASGGSKTEERLVTPESWTIEQGGKVVARRGQLPLKLAWAITIHKSQGMTISKMTMSLRAVFEPGMA